MDEHFDYEVLNILNGQHMYEEFSSQQLMGKSDYAPFNEAMCVHDTVETIFSESFKQIRATGHQVSLAEYESITVEPLEKTLFSKKYQCIVIVTGEKDFITDGQQAQWITGGHLRMTAVTGTGCLLSAICCTAYSAGNEPFAQLRDSLMAYKKVAEYAASATQVNGDFAVSILNELHRLSKDGEH